MPEGHTVHRMAQDHTQWIGGQRLLISSPQGRFEHGAEQLSGKVLKSVEAHGKHLYYVFGAQHPLHVHLGLYGKFRLHQSPPPDPRGAVRVRFVGVNHRGHRKHLPRGNSISESHSSYAAQQFAPAW